MSESQDSTGRQDRLSGLRDRHGSRKAELARARTLRCDLHQSAHGAAMETPADAQFLLDHTTCDGFWTGSSTERLPIGRAITEVAAESAALRLPDRS